MTENETAAAAAGHTTDVHIADELNHMKDRLWDLNAAIFGARDQADAFSNGVGRGRKRTYGQPNAGLESSAVGAAGLLGVSEEGKMSEMKRLRRGRMQA